MDDRICFQLPINLQKYCAVRISAILWERPDIKKDLEDILRSVSTLSFHESHKIKMKCPFEDEKWWEITEKVLHHIESLNLPSGAKMQVSECIIFMGKKIYLMFLMIGPDVKFNPKMLKRFFFTNQGVLDRFKMYQQWKTDPCFPDFHDDADINLLIASYLACVYGDFDFLRRQSLRNISTAILNNIESGLIIKDWNRVIAALLIWRKSPSFPESSPMLQKYCKIIHEPLFKNSNYPNGEENLFQYCVENGYERAAEYFYSKLDEIDKESMVFPAATKSIVNFRSTGGEIEKTSEEYLEKKVRVIMFVLKKMSDEKKKQFLFEKMTDVFPIFLKTWPYNYLCVELLDYVWEDISAPAKSLILEICFRQLYDLSTLHHHNIVRPVHHEILQFLLRKTPADLKFDVFTHKNRYDPSSLEDRRNGLFELFKKSDFISLKMIITDPDLVQHREQLINIAGLLTEYILKENDFELVRDKITMFMKQSQFSNSEKDKFFGAFNKIEVFEKMIRDVRFSAVNKLVKWIYDSDREKMDERLNEIREALDSNSIYSYIFENWDCSSAERFLQWLYDERYEELEKFKRLTFSNEFICEKFWYTWLKTYFNSNFDSLIARFECFKFLEYFFKTQTEIDEFKKYAISENDNCIKMFCKSLVKLLVNVKNRTQEIRRERLCSLMPRPPPDSDLTKCVKITGPKNFSTALNDALTFCSATTDKINEIKQTFKSNIDWWCESSMNNKFEFLILNALVNWVQFEKSEMKIFIPKFLESSKGALLCVNIFTDDGFPGLFEARTILRDWKKQYADVKKMREELEKLQNADAAGIRDAMMFLYQL